MESTFFKKEDNPTHSPFFNVNGKTNREAERALIRVKEKLQGYEDGTYLSVEGQVNLLIQTAKDPNLLCLLYPGWSPWL
jgi:phosphatidylinositol kinase/protein kinase (PI-3  family)